MFRSKKRPSSGQHYKSFKILYNKVQIMFVNGIPCDLQSKGKGKVHQGTGHEDPEGE